MIKKLLEISRLYLYTTFFKKSSTLIFSLAIPLIFTFLIGQAIPSGSSDDEVVVIDSWSIAISDEDNQQMSKKLVNLLENDPQLMVSTDIPNPFSTDIEFTNLFYEENEIEAVLILPEDFSQNLLSGNDVSIQYLANPYNTPQAQIVENAIMANIIQFEGAVLASEVSSNAGLSIGLFETDEVNEIDFKNNSLDLANTYWKNPPVKVIASPASKLDNGPSQSIPGGINQTSPGMMVIFSLFFITGGTSALLLEREQGTLRRLMVMPIKKVTILSGKLFGVFLSGIIQISLLIMAGQFFFNINWGQNPAALFIMVISFTFCITALGMLLAAIARSYAQADAMSTIIVMSLSGLGGAMWPIEIVPEWMQSLGHIFPTAWAMDGFHDIITRGLGIYEVLPEVGILLIYGIIFLSIGIKYFSYE